MKMKQIAALALAGLMAVSVAGCGKASDQTSSDDSAPQAEIEYKALDYVTLGDYKGVEISLDSSDYVVTKKMIKSQIESDISSHAVYVKKKGDTVKEDSIVNVDYVGKMDGEAFENGSAEDVNIDVANNASVDGTTFIDGFTEGLAGAKVGDTVDVEVTFPEDYSDSTYAGKDAVFTFTINKLMKKKDYTYKNITDDYVKDNLGYDTVKEYKKAVKENLKTSLESQKQSDIQSGVLNAVVSNAKIDGTPDGLLDMRVDQYISSYKAQIEAYGMEYEDYLTNYMSTTKEDFEEQINTYMESTVQQEEVLRAVAETEGIEVTDDELEEYIDSIVSNYGYEDEDALLKQYDKSYISNSYLYYSKVSQFLVDNAKVTYTEGDSDSSSDK